MAAGVGGQLKPKHGIKQVDRFLPSNGIEVAALHPGWARFVIGPW